MDLLEKVKGLQSTLLETFNPMALSKTISVHDLLSSKSKVYRKFHFNASYLEAELPVHITPG